MLAARVSFAKPLLADGVGKVEQMQLMRHFGLDNQRTHPVAIADGVGGKIQDDGKVLPQDIDNVRPDRRAKPR